MAAKKARSLKTTFKSGGRTYRQKTCHTSKSAAERAAKSLRNKGDTAQVKSGFGKHCVYSAGKRKKGTIKRTGQTLSGRRRKK